MNSIELNSAQVKALVNNAEMLWIPTIDLSHRENMGGINMLYPDYIKKFIEVHSPLQTGQEYYVAEKFSIIDNEDFYLDKKECSYLEDSYDIVEYNASQMQEHQSRIKFKVIDVKVKRIQNITYRERCSMSIPKNGAYWEKDVENWHNEQYSDQPYETNPYGFLVQIERIHK